MMPGPNLCQSVQICGPTIHDPLCAHLGIDPAQKNHKPEKLVTPAGSQTYSPNFRGSRHLGAHKRDAPREEGGARVVRALRVVEWPGGQAFMPKLATAGGLFRLAGTARTRLA